MSNHRTYSARVKRLWPALKMTFLIILWLVIFIVGYHVDSGSFRTPLRAVKGHDLLELNTLGLVLGSIFTWTWSNCLLLCCLAAVVGDIGRHVSGNHQEGSGLSLNRVAVLTEYRPALSRAFFVFILVLSGQLILSGGIVEVSRAIEPTDSGRYFRIASSISFLGFMAGYNPEFFLNLLGSAISRAEARASAASDERKEKK